MKGNLRALDQVRRRNPLPASAQLDAFSFEQVEAIHAGRQTGWLVSASARAPKPESVRALRRVVRVLDGDGNSTGAMLVETTATVLTIRDVSGALWMDEVEDQHALACGFRSCGELQAAWLRRHPRTRRVRFVRFQVGDVRDRDWFMDRGGGYTLSPAQSIQPDAPVPVVDASGWATRNRMSPVQRERQQRSLSIRLKQAKGDELKAVVQEIVEFGETLEEAA